MKTFNLTQASCSGIELDSEMFNELEEKGFDIQGTKTKRIFGGIEIYENVTITFNTLDDLVRFIDEVGPIVIYEKGEITIYDDYIE